MKIKIVVFLTTLVCGLALIGQAQTNDVAAKYGQKPTPGWWTSGDPYGDGGATAGGYAQSGMLPPAPVYVQQPVVQQPVVVAAISPQQTVAVNSGDAARLAAEEAGTRARIAAEVAGTQARIAAEVAGSQARYAAEAAGYEARLASSYGGYGYNGYGNGIGGHRSYGRLAVGYGLGSGYGYNPYHGHYCRPLVNGCRAFVPDPSGHVQFRARF